MDGDEGLTLYWRGGGVGYEEGCMFWELGSEWG